MKLIGGVSISKSIRPEVHLDGLELGYHVAEAHQGKGYAAEGAKAALEWAMERFCFQMAVWRFEKFILSINGRIYEKRQFN